MDDKLIQQRKDAFRSYHALTPPRVLTSDGETRRPRLGTGPDQAPAPAMVITEADPPDAGVRSATAEQSAAATQVRDVAAEILEHGVAGAGAVTQADLLRAIHQARAIGLPRLATAATRVVEQLSPPAAVP